jgi:hypothetical protein
MRLTRFLDSRIILAGLRQDSGRAF